MSQINMQLDVSFLTRPIPDEQGLPASEGEIYDTEMTLIVDDDGVQINLYPEARDDARIRVEHDKRTGRIVCLIWLKGQAVGDPDQMIELVPAVNDWRQRVADFFYNEGAPLVDNWRDLEDDPDQEILYTYAQQSGRFSAPWRPFDQELRTQALIDDLKQTFEQEIEDFQNEPL